MQIVVAAVIEREGLILIGQRHAGKWHGLKWEFPGGKVESGETPAAALGRELEEELSIHAEIGRVIADYHYEYPERAPIQLMFFRVTRFTGEIRNREYHDLRWESPERLPEYNFLEGDLDFVRRLASSPGASPAPRDSDSTEP